MAPEEAPCDLRYCLQWCHSVDKLHCGMPVSATASQPEGCGLETRLGNFCVEFACSLRALCPRSKNMHVNLCMKGCLSLWQLGFDDPLYLLSYSRLPGVGWDRLPAQVQRLQVMYGWRTRDIPPFLYGALFFLSKTCCSYYPQCNLAIDWQHWRHFFLNIAGLKITCSSII